jgi:hypothetical protein
VLIRDQELIDVLEFRGQETIDAIFKVHPGAGRHRAITHARRSAPTALRLRD